MPGSICIRLFSVITLLVTGEYLRVFHRCSQAWAAGLPVLASQLGGIVDFATDRETALLFDPQNEEAIARGMTELAEDETLRNRLSRNALGAVGDYGWSAVAARTREIYESVIMEQQARR